MFTYFSPTVFRAVAGTVLATVLVLAGSPAPAIALEPGEFDPADFDSLLGLYVGEDGVDYVGWKAAGAEGLDRFLERAAAHDLTSTLGKEPRAALLVNAYNAWAVRQVLEHYPVESLEAIPGFFDGNAVAVAGEERTLNDIETTLAKILPHRPVFAFALAPGARGMPPLAPRAYTSDDLISRCGKAAAAYIADGPRVRLDKENHALHLPPQFQTHWALFDKDPRGLLGFLANHLALSDVMAISKSDPDYVFDPVDWALRDASGGGETEEEGEHP